MSDEDEVWERETWDRAVFQATTLISKAGELKEWMRQLEETAAGDSRIASALEVLRSQQLSLAESKIALLQLMSDEESTANDRELIEQHLQMLSLVEDELAGDARTQQ